MDGDDGAARVATDLQLAFEVQAAPGVPHSRRGARERFGARVEREPMTAGVGSLVDDGQARARAGDRRAKVDRAGVIGGADDEPRVAAVLAAADGADVGYDAGEHVRPQIILMRS